MGIYYTDIGEGDSDFSYKTDCCLSSIAGSFNFDNIFYNCGCGDEYIPELRREVCTSKTEIIESKNVRGDKIL